jgi:hypothetical protein
MPQRQTIRAGGTGGVGTEAPTRGRVAAPVHPRGLKVLGHLVSAEYRVWIYAERAGGAGSLEQTLQPRYTVCSLDGRVLSDDLAADDMYREFPTLDISGMILPVEGSGDDDGLESGPLMLVEPKE